MEQLTLMWCFPQLWFQISKVNETRHQCSLSIFMKETTHLQFKSLWNVVVQEIYSLSKKYERFEQTNMYFRSGGKECQNVALQTKRVEHHDGALQMDISKGRCDWFKTWAAYYFFSPQTEWLSHPKLNGFTQQRRKSKEGRKSRSVVGMNEWGCSGAASWPR